VDGFHPYAIFSDHAPRPICSAPGKSLILTAKMTPPEYRFSFDYRCFAFLDSDLPDRHKNSGRRDRCGHSGITPPTISRIDWK
jgi:hypothetical protein